MEYANYKDMYLRTTSRKNKDGTVVRYLSLAHNERNPKTGVSTPRNIFNFGRADQLDRAPLVRLCQSIARVCNLEVRDPSKKEDVTTDEEASGPADDMGLPSGVELIETLELGTVHVIEALWERLELGPTLRRLMKGKECAVPYERALFAITANRLCEPESKLGVWGRWLKTVYLPSCQDLKLAQMYEAMDQFYEHAAEIEETVFFRTADLFNLEVDVVFYDTTTASFTIDYEDDDDGEDEEALRIRGKTKEGGWKPQVVVALAVTKEGLPVRSWVFPGNTSDVNTVKKVKADLKGWKLGRALFVADAGMNSEDNRQELRKACGKYLLATRMGSVKEIQEDVLSRPGRFKTISENLRAKEVIVGDGVRSRRYILCHNPKEADRQQKHRAKVVRELESELPTHQDLTATASWAMKLKASGRYGRYLKVNEKGHIQIDRDAIKKAARMDGKWVVETNDDTLSVEETASSYKALLVIERCFRSLKRTRIKMMPLHHRLNQRIETHVKLCVLALLIERIAELSCKESWPQIKRTLATLQATRIQTEQHQFFQRNQPSKAVLSLLKKLTTSLPKRVFSIQDQT